MNVIRTGLSAYRLTKLVIDDKITEKLRARLYELAEGNEMLTYLLGCPWCISIYTGVLAVALEKVAPEVNSALSASAITGLLYSNLG